MASARPSRPAVFHWRWAVGVAACCASIALAGPFEDTEAANAAFARGDLIVAMRLLRRAADANHAPAQVRLAEILDAAEEDVAAVELYRRAAAQEYAPAEHGLGVMYAKGEGVQKDAKESARWFLRAAQRNHLPAVEVVAIGYRTGTAGFALDPAQGEAWSDRAVALGGKRPVLAPAPPRGAAPGVAGKS